MRYMLLVAAMLVGPGSAVLAQEIGLSIDEIVEDEQISGRVTGLSPDEVAGYKVVVYVHTDQWYIHPYAGQAEGRSWASITPSGAWTIKTVKREFSADRVGALLVERSLQPPSRVRSLAAIESRAQTVKDLSGTPDHGKL